VDVVIPPRVEQLARRVRWFDAYRHELAFGIAIGSGLFGWIILPHILGADWPVFFVRFMSAGASLFIGITVEIVLAGALGVWEAEHDRLVRERGLPQARALRRK
jgi:hypothetical protein